MLFGFVCFCFFKWDSYNTVDTCDVVMELCSSCFQGVESVKKEIGDLGHTGPYRPPARLRKRSEFSSKGAGEEKVFEANEYVFPRDLQYDKEGML